MRFIYQILLTYALSVLFTQPLILFLKSCWVYFKYKRNNGVISEATLFLDQASFGRNAHKKGEVTQTSQQLQSPMSNSSQMQMTYMDQHQFVSVGGKIQLRHENTSKNEYVD